MDYDFWKKKMMSSNEDSKVPVWEYDFGQKQMMTPIKPKQEKILTKVEKKETPDFKEVNITEIKDPSYWNEVDRMYTTLKKQDYPWASLASSIASWYIRETSLVDKETDAIEKKEGKDLADLYYYNAPLYKKLKNESEDLEFDSEIKKYISDLSDLDSSFRKRTNKREDVISIYEDIKKKRNDMNQAFSKKSQEKKDEKILLEKKEEAISDLSELEYKDRYTEKEMDIIIDKMININNQYESIDPSDKISKKILDIKKDVLLWHPDDLSKKMKAENQINELKIQLEKEWKFNFNDNESEEESFWFSM